MVEEDYLMTDADKDEPGRNIEEQQSDPKTFYCPRWLDDDAKKEWRRLSGLLIQEGLLTERTYNSFAAYCQEWSRYQKQQAFIREKGAVAVRGKKVLYEVPQISIAYKALRAMYRAAEDIGLSRAEGNER